MAKKKAKSKGKAAAVIVLPMPGKKSADLGAKPGRGFGGGKVTDRGVKK